MAHWQTECKNCGSTNLVRFGTDRKGKQRFRCKDCGYTFTDTGSPPGMRFPANVIGFTLNEFYESASLSKIQRGIQMTYQMRPDPSNIYRWIVRYSKEAVKAFDDVPINVGDVWVADETVLKLKEGGNTWFFDCVDRDTRFLLASHLTPSRYTRDAQTLMERAERRAGKSPKAVITDKLKSYLGAVEDVFGADARHIQSGPFKIQMSTRDIERFHGTLKDRTKVLRSLANRESARIVLDGWLIHYNFFRPHGGLDGRTPAEAAKASGVPFSNWLEVVTGEKAKEMNPNRLYEAKLVRP
jgi:transposase-like protein